MNTEEKDWQPGDRPKDMGDTINRMTDREKIQCVGCFLEVHAGQREKINPAVLVVGGNSTCLEHLQIQQGPVVPGRTASGLILGGQ